MVVRRTTRDWLFSAVEGLWALGLRAARPLIFDGEAPRSWQPGGRVVVVAPHPDDETLGAGGVIARHRQHGDPVSVAVITDGRGSQAAGLTQATMARLRAEELSAAVQTLGVSKAVFLGLPEGSWETANARANLAPLLSSADVVYVPSCVDFHPEHLRVARLLGELLQPGQTVRVYELSVPLTAVLVNLVADISSVQAQKQQALACFDTQRMALEPLARLARYRRSLYGLAASEVFWEMPAPAYARIMRYGTWGWEDSPFRAIRPRPFGDPLAFLMGRATRHRLRELAEGHTT